MNVLWTISVEDDLEQSVFFNELRNIVLNTPERGVMFLMYYRSLAWRKALFLKYYQGKWIYRALPFAWSHSRILKYFLDEMDKVKYNQISLYLSAHCWKNTLYTKGSGKGEFTTKALSKWGLKNGVYWDLIIFDCCYMSTVENIENLSQVSNYMIALETSQGYVGFQMPNLMSLFVEGDIPRLAKRIANTFVKQESPIKRLGWAADVAIVDLEAGMNLVKWVKKHHHMLIMNDKTRVEICKDKKCKKEYDLFDLWSSVKDKTKEFKTIFEDTLIYYGQNRVMRENIQLSSRLHGIGVSL